MSVSSASSLCAVTIADWWRSCLPPCTSHIPGFVLSSFHFLPTRICVAPSLGSLNTNVVLARVGFPTASYSFAPASAVELHQWDQYAATHSRRTSPRSMSAWVPFSLAVLFCCTSCMISGFALDSPFAMVMAARPMGCPSVSAFCFQRSWCFCIASLSGSLCQTCGSRSSRFACAIACCSFFAVCEPNPFWPCLIASLICLASTFSSASMSPPLVTTVLPGICWFSQSNRSSRSAAFLCSSESS